ncbi:PIN domain-containing protein [Spongiactinospora sp. 9N601]|uniref:PIN domain-containing protein n=1 Tax=Spongiactinospora sp. 9N601 TaxID=3375149 RepID=UPI0037B9EE0C
MRASAPRAALVYDAGALIAAEANRPRMWRLHRQALDEKRRIIVPVPVLAQVWRGSARQASLARLLFGCEIADMTERIGKEAGVLCGRVAARRRTAPVDVVDATVVVVAIMAAAAILTSDHDDLVALTDAADPVIRPALIEV